ncbi:uncharacterized protein LOC129601002 [Paramacrobiotus metropolitanus]|uniref:uncharacterized protein LOC129601002 n=1 Tax=Paramacrobiotus metropolitanus TaxID=2943436 RepID=UPI002445D23F|nr:uncharacterized protein LOC129601002 [Paramacrobiotus metropolitanus]
MTTRRLVRTTVTLTMHCISTVCRLLTTVGVCFLYRSPVFTGGSYLRNWTVYNDIDSVLVTTTPAELEDTFEYQLPFVCSFDQQEALRFYPSYCGIVQDEFEDDWNWIPRSGAPPTAHTGPRNDHSPSGQGYYLHFESSQPAQEGQVAIFATPWLSASHENVCISFFFNMEGDVGMGFLDVFLDITGQVDPLTVFQTDGAHGKHWLAFYEQIRVPVQRSFRIRFMATRGKSFRSDVAIDDIVVKEVHDDESCVPLARYPNIMADSVLFCDLDSGNCPLEALAEEADSTMDVERAYVETSEETSQYSWRVAMVDKYKFGTGPDLGDHTKGKLGQFLLAASEAGRPGSSARVKIPLEMETVVNRSNASKSDLCVEFYYMTFGRHLGELRINIFKNEIEHEFITIKHPTNRAWYSHGKVLLNAHRKANMSLVVEAIRGQSNLSDIAVDDIHVYYCTAQDNPTYDVAHAHVLVPLCRKGAVACPEKDGCMLPEYLCDGIPHCINGSDEKFCAQQLLTECGVPSIPPSELVSKIIFGQTVRPHSWPWQIALIDNSQETQFCGGSIIHPFWILTAAHCLAEYSTKEHGRLNNMIVRVGEHNLLQNLEASQTDYQAAGLYMHPEFNKPLRANDFGLIRLRQPILFRKEVQAVCLPWFSSTPLSSTCVVTGWGHSALTVSEPTDERFRRHRRNKRGAPRNKRAATRLIPSKYLAGHHGHSVQRKAIRSFTASKAQADSQLRRFMTVLTHPTDLQQLYLPILPDEVCRNASQYAGVLSESMLCAGYMQSMTGDSCHGDSGGPLTCKRPDGSWEVHGVTSFGSLRCAEEGHPGIYSRVVHALDWIVQVMGDDAKQLKKKRSDHSSTIDQAPAPVLHSPGHG